MKRFSIHLESGNKPNYVHLWYVVLLTQNPIEHMPEKGVYSRIRGCKTYSTEGVYTQSRNNFNDVKKAHKMPLRFKRDEKFSERIGQDMNEYTISNLEAVIYYDLNQDKDLDFFQPRFGGEATQLYRSNVQHVFDSHAEASARLWNEYRAIARKNGVRKSSKLVTSIYDRKESL